MTNQLDAIAPDIDIQGQTIALTGGATGLGRKAVETFAGLGAIQQFSTPCLTITSTTRSTIVTWNNAGSIAL